MKHQNTSKIRIGARERQLILGVLLLAGAMELFYAGLGESLLEAQLPDDKSALYPYCGDSLCSNGEDPFSCPQDCPPVCGDGICNPGESLTCLEDCDIAGTCGDGVCDIEEDETTCTQDCPAGCGNGLCEAGEDETICPTDCAGPPQTVPVCGDGLCELGGDFPESSFTCPADCGEPAFEPPPPPPAPPICGDGACDLGENPCNCTADCGPVGDPGACACGDGVCDGSIDEDCVTCAEDCGSCLPDPTGVCGDGVCDGTQGETCVNCSDDCGFCPVFDIPAEDPPADPDEQSDGLDPDFQIHWQMDTSSEDYAVELEFDATREVATPLVDSDGRRDVVIRPAGSTMGGTSLSTTANTWNFWAGGIKAPNGMTVVCWNRFVGQPSSATAGEMPDPRGGVALLCAVDSGQGFSPETVIEAGQPAAWLQEFRVSPNGEPIAVYVLDAFGTLINTGQPGDGEVEVTFHP